MSVELETTSVITSVIDGTDNITTYYDTPPNATPVLTDITVAMDWNTIFSFLQSTITDNYSDVDGDGLLVMQIVTIPLLGYLTLSGLPVSIGQEITLANISNLKFTPQANHFGNDYDSFLVRVKDNGIPPNSWSEEALISFDITKQNQEPTVDNNLVEIPYVGTYIFIVDDLIVNYNDVEGDILGYIEFSSIPPENSGYLLLDDVVVIDQDLPLQLTPTDINSGRLKYIDSGELINEKQILVDYTVFDNNI